MIDGNARQRIAMLGGGISSLTTAYHLSRTPELRARYEVTVHQMGWRLGGKLASGREPDRGMRNVEHGLHVWFGFYDNAFNLFKELFARWKKPVDCPYSSWKDAFTPRSYTPIGETIDGKLTYWQVEFPQNDAEPGGDEVPLDSWGVVTEVLSFVKNLIERLLGDDDWHVPELVRDLVAGIMVGPVAVFQHALEIAAKIDDLDDEADRFDALRWMLQEFQQHVVPILASHVKGDVDRHHFLNGIDVGTAMVLGLLNPDYGITNDWNLDRIDHLEFREFLLANGATPKIVNEWGVVRAIYDAWFEYRDGDPAQPDFAAGAGIRVLLRIGTTYKGSVLYLVDAGMGETVISPLYEVLKDQGVRFEFFHKLKTMQLTKDGASVERLVFERQAAMVGGKPYEPTFVFKGLTCWPHEPDWRQLEGGAQLSADGVNFESNWSAYAPAGETTLELGKHFDAAVLGICAGVYKRLNAEPSICQEVIDRSPAFRAMTESVGLVPSIGVQLWVTKDLSELGFDGGPPAMVHGSYPNDVWADMTQTLRHEGWAAGNQPKGVHYLCGTIGTQLYAAPTSDATVPQRAYDIVLEATQAQLENPSAGIASVWPRALVDGKFDWQVLFDAKNAVGPARLKAQYVRANVDPTECCVGTAAGTTRFRLAADQTGVANLYLAGEVASTGMNSSCVEGAVMAGMQAAAAISGVALNIVGDDFMRGASQIGDSPDTVRRAG